MFFSKYNADQMFSANKLNFFIFSQKQLTLMKWFGPHKPNTCELRDSNLRLRCQNQTSIFTSTL